MKYLYGPVKSRRLGLSLGVNLTPYKICTFSCVYCQLGVTTKLIRERKEYLDIIEIISELSCWLGYNAEVAKELSYITLSGSGEPTLNIGIGRLIERIKKITAIPVALLTNSSLLDEPLLRNEICALDLIVPSLDAVTPVVFQKIDRPLAQIKIEEIISSLISLRSEFRGKIWLEVMLVKGYNDDLRQIKRLKQVIDKIRPDRIHLNSPVRAAVSANILPVDKNKLKKISQILGENCEVI